ncbi:SIR2 family protein [Cupriavidus oxalaticus]|uniref:Uncharacterized protein n=1 Tax=Cupriavidus oxalaticus TaxID=96344 RepID=A0A4P7LH55_9BURK|nr:SIR2 family protein [Cupriavidus oxalaticus]QBY55466.1 hypothetical protein E0W60_30990 [Cupriavidus oxalaticus]
MNDPVQHLRDEYAYGNLCLFIGAGVSVGCGLPDWRKLAEEVLQAIPHKQWGNLPPHLLGKARPLTGELDPNWHLPYVKDILGSVDPLYSMRYIRADKHLDLKDLVRVCLYKHQIQLSDIARELPLLSNARRICCFNYDDILCRAFDEADCSFSPLFPGQKIPLESSNRLIFYPHGYLPDPDRASFFQKTEAIVLSEEDYFELYRLPYSWANMVQLTLLMNYTALFIGCSLSDPNVRRLLDVCANKGRHHQHFAFMLNPYGSAAKLNWLELKHSAAFEKFNGSLYKGLGVKILWVNDFRDIASILSAIRSSA